MLRFAFDVNELIYILQNVSLTFQYVSVTCLNNDNYYYGTIHGMADTSNRYNAVLQTVFNLTSFIYCNHYHVLAYTVHRHIYSIGNEVYLFLS